jgi:phosphatidylglycerol---prolipoprotein diacylglyceryl transferase
MRLSPYGACAAAGLMLGMALAGRSARRVQVLPEAMWDTGFFAIACCFVTSRLLLILSDLRAFAQFPILVLSLPSLTIGGIALAAVAVAVYIWRKQLPAFRLLDAFAPSGALLAAFLELGHWLDGSEIGMPVLRGANHAVVGFRPVSMYGVLLALGLVVVLWRALGLRARPGRAAAVGLILGGAAAFGLDTLTVPAELFSNLPLEPGQIVALGAMLGGAVLWALAPEALPQTAVAKEPEPHQAH